MRNPSTPDCAIKGCTRAAHKGFLCRQHYALVPYSMVRETMWRSIEAQVAEARKMHRRQLAHVRKQLAHDPASDL